MSLTQSTLFLYGFGNPGRQDDGLGIALAEHFEKKSLPGITIDSNYQLNAEDALEISEKDIVLFADASQNDIGSFRLTRLIPALEVEFTTHAMSPESVLALCNQLYNKYPAAYLLEMKGYEWELKEGLTDAGEKNLKKAIDFISPLIENPSVSRFEEQCEDA